MKDDGYKACLICEAPAMGSGKVCCLVGREIHLVRLRYPSQDMDVILYGVGVGLASRSPGLSPVVAAETLRRLFQLEQAERMERE